MRKCVNMHERRTQSRSSLALRANVATNLLLRERGSRCVSTGYGGNRCVSRADETELARGGCTMNSPSEASNPPRWLRRRSWQPTNTGRTRQPIRPRTSVAECAPRNAGRCETSPRADTHRSALRSDFSSDAPFSEPLYRVCCAICVARTEELSRSHRGYFVLHVHLRAISMHASL